MHRLLFFFLHFSLLLAAFVYSIFRFFLVVHLNFPCEMNGEQVNQVRRRKSNNILSDGDDNKQQKRNRMKMVNIVFLLCIHYIARILNNQLLHCCCFFFLLSVIFNIAVVYYMRSQLDGRTKVLRLNIMT